MRWSCRAVSTSRLFGCGVGRGIKGVLLFVDEWSVSWVVPDS